MENFKPKSFIGELFIPKKDLADYYVKKRAYNYAHNKEKLSTFKFQKRIHNILMKLFGLNRKLIDKQNYTIMSDKSNLDGKNVIFAITHIGKFDYQIVTEALKVHTIPFAGDPELTYRNFDGFIFNINGVVFLDTESKTDRKVAYGTALEVLKNGYHLMIFPEGIWNLSPNNIVQPIYPGVIKMASESNCEIIPVAVEQYGSDFIINIGENIKIGEGLSKEQVELEKQNLRDAMATLKYEIFEVFPKPLVRKEMASFEEEKTKFVNSKLDEYVNPETKQNYFTEEFVENRVYKEKDVVSPEEVYSFMKTMEPNSNNAFLYRRDSSIPEFYEEEAKEIQKRR